MTSFWTKSQSLCRFRTGTSCENHIHTRELYHIAREHCCCMNTDTSESLCFLPGDENILLVTYANGNF
jgi:hypothetical protein